MVVITIKDKSKRTQNYTHQSSPINAKVFKLTVNITNWECVREAEKTLLATLSIFSFPMETFFAFTFSTVGFHKIPQAGGRFPPIFLPFFFVGCLIFKYRSSEQACTILGPKTMAASSFPSWTPCRTTALTFRPNAGGGDCRWAINPRPSRLMYHSSSKTSFTVAF